MTDAGQQDGSGEDGEHIELNDCGVFGELEGVCPSGCGNNRLEVGEECDDGDQSPGDGCDELCRKEACRNGRLDEGEECDDGNTENNDGCNNICEIEVPREDQVTNECPLTGRCDEILEEMNCPDGVILKTITVGGIDDYQSPENYGSEDFYAMNDVVGQTPRVPAFDNDGSTNQFSRADLRFSADLPVACAAYFARIRSLDSAWDTDSSFVMVANSDEFQYCEDDTNCWRDHFTTQDACSTSMASFSEPLDGGFVTAFSVCDTDFVEALNHPANNHLYFHSQDDHGVDYLQLLIGYEP